MYTWLHDSLHVLFTVWFFSLHQYEALWPSCPQWQSLLHLIRLRCLFKKKLKTFYLYLAKEVMWPSKCVCVCSFVSIFAVHVCFKSTRGRRCSERFSGILCLYLVRIVLGKDRKWVGERGKGLGIDLGWDSNPDPQVYGRANALAHWAKVPLGCVALCCVALHCCVAYS